MLGAAYEDEAIDALKNRVPRPPEPAKVSAWRAVRGIATAPTRGVTSAVAEAGASLAETIGGFGQVLGAYPEAFGYSPTGQARQQADDARTRLLRDGVDMNNPVGDALREAGRSYRPDAQTATIAEQVLYGFARGATKVVAGAATAGPIGVVGAGLEEANTQADELRVQGVPFGPRVAAGAVQGAGLALAALPLVGQTLPQTAALYLAGGPGGFIAQQALTREILQNAGQADIAAQFDPFDPVGLSVATLLPAAFTAYGLRGQRLQRAADSLPPTLAEAEGRTAPPEPAQTFPVRSEGPPSELRPTAQAARAYPTEAVDAAMVVHLAEMRARANPAGDAPTMRAADQHAAALARAETQIAAGERVEVADVALMVESIRPAPFEQRDTLPAGAWVRLPYPDSRGQPIAQVRDVPVADLYLPELTADGRLQPEKRTYLPEYTARAVAGEVPPNIDAVQMEDGRIRVVDGHRRVMAAREAGAPTIRATVSPLIDVPGEGKVPLTVAARQFPDRVDGAMTAPIDTFATTLRASLETLRAELDAARAEPVAPRQPEATPNARVTQPGTDAQTTRTAAPTTEAPTPAGGAAATAADVPGTGSAAAEAGRVTADPVMSERIAAVQARFPDLMVQMDGMDKPMPLAEFMATVQREADADVAGAPDLMDAATCALLNGG